jgi:hypothetical protein
VKHIYQFTEARDLREANSYQKFLLDTRNLLAAQFREQHGSFNLDKPECANVYPYFIGVFDTVAALGSWKKTALFALAFLICAIAVSFLVPWLQLLFDVPVLAGLKE